MVAPSAPAPRLALTRITKRFPAVLANDDVSLDVAAGEVHALLGENGAGKSTLMKIIAGALQPDAGEIRLDGALVQFAAPSDAARAGIAMVYQQFTLFDALTVAENVALGLPRPLPLRDVAVRIRELARHHDLPLDPHAPVHDLSMGERQRVEILRALMAAPRLLILDEPTSVLTPQAAERLFATLRALAAGGVSVLFISHKLHEILRVADRCTVMRAGRVVATVDPRTQSEASLARLMIGADPPVVAQHALPPGAPLLALASIVLPGQPEATGRELVVRAGEIVGVAGISGNGQRELMAVLAGEAPVAAAAVRLADEPIGHLPTRARRRRGVRYVPEQRLGHATVAELSLAENALLTGDDLQRHGFVRKQAMVSFARRVIERFDVRGPGVHARAANLSGGNLQKFVVGREALQLPAHGTRVLLVNQPTAGLDVGAAAAIRNALVALREAGAALLVVSEELDELFELCDRLLVIAQGRLSPAVEPHAVSMDDIGRWMAGVPAVAVQ